MRMLLGTLITAAMAWGQGNCPAPIAGNADGNYIVPGSQGDIVYANGLTMDVYAPAGDPRPAALVIHGSRGDKRGYITSIYEQLTRDGYAWFAPNFRNADADVAAALAFIRCPGRFNITGKMVLIGDDTGARTALKLAAAGKIDGVIAVSAKLDDTSAQSLKIDAPVLMIHGTEDEQWPLAKAQAFCGRLKNCSVYPEHGARHVFENWFPSQWDYKEEMDAWLAGDRRGLWDEIPFARPDGRALTMNAYIPRGEGPFPAVIIAHGGGWEGGDKVVYVPPIFKPLAKAGFAWFSIDYRLLPYVHNPEQIEDMRAAIRYVKEHAARYQVDPRKIAIFGESASGQMVAQIGAEACPGCEVQAVVSFYGVYKFEEGGRQGLKLEAMFGADRTAETLRRYSPLYAVHAGMPPVLVVQGDKDPLFAGSNEYVEKLKQAGVPHEYVVVHGAPHGIENWEGHPEWSFYKHKVVDWLNATPNYRTRPLDSKNAISGGNGQCPAVEGDADGDYIVPGTVAGVPYGSGETMDVYAPRGEPRPAAIVIRGHHGNQFNFVTKLYEQLARSGYAWFAPDYRDAADLSAAIKFVGCPGRFNIGKTLVLIGEDNGAAIALKLAKSGAGTGVVTVAASLGDAQENLDVKVPVLMIQGDRDKEFSSSQAKAFCGRLKTCSVYVQSPAPHVFEQWHPQSEDYREELDAWLRQDERGVWKDISYSRPGGRDLAMDAFIPKGIGPFPAVIIIHGGGFARDKVTYIAPIFEPLAKSGIAWFSIDYTSPAYARFPAELDQVRDAIRYIRKHAARYRVDPNRLAVMGESFSAPMAAIVASKPCQGCEVQAVLSFYGNYRPGVPQDAAGRARLDALYGAGAWSAETLQGYAPFSLAHSGMPPVLVVQGTGEAGGLARSKEYSDHLKELGVRTELVVVEGAPHGIENWEGHPEWGFYKKSVVDWLKSVWK